MITHFAVADFDGDQKPDLATVETGRVNSSETRYWIRFDLSTGNRESIGVIAPLGGLHLDSRDVNGDRFPDLLVTTTFLHQPVAVLLNDGHGKFTLANPASFPPSIWEGGTGWSLPPLRLRDDAAVPLGRRQFRGTKERQSLATPRFPPGRMSLPSASLPVPRVHSSSASRAPPLFVSSL
jgi:hypothetical protein